MTEALMIFNTLIDKYKTRYHIPFQDLKDFGETNRINALVVSSLLLFFFELIPTAAILSPGVYKNYGVLSVVDLFVVTVIMFAIALYKRHHEKRHLQLLRKQKLILEAKTFGNFTLLHENKVITFSRTKSEELLAYLIYKKGTSVKTKELINVLWGEQADSARYGNSFRNLIVDIKHTMNELEIQNFFITEYNNFRIDPEVIKCDYYDFLEGDPTAIKNFAGEFMNQYSWAKEIVDFLNQKTRK